MNRLTYTNVVSTLALFVALGGASYAAVALPANSVGTRQLAFPLGVKSREVGATKAPVFVCSAGERCPHFGAKTLVSLDVSLKKASKLLVIGQTDAYEGRSAKHGPTTLSFGATVGGRVLGEEYPLGVHTGTENFAEVVPTRAGRHVIRLTELAQSQSGPARTVYFSPVEIAVIALPRLR